MVTSGITQEELIAWGGPDIFNQALAIVNSGDVTHVEYDDDKLEVRGRIEQPSGFEMPVALELKEKGRIRSRCPCRLSQQYGQVCPHVVALGIALMVKEMPDVDEEPRQDEARPVEEDAGDFIPVPMPPKFSAYLLGSRRSLSIEVDAIYGEIVLPACSPQEERVVWLEDPDDPLVRRVRSM